MCCKRSEPRRPGYPPALRSAKRVSRTCQQDGACALLRAWTESVQRACQRTNVPMFSVCVAMTNTRFVYRVRTNRVGTPQTKVSCVRVSGMPASIALSVKSGTRGIRILGNRHCTLRYDTVLVLLAEDSRASLRSALAAARSAGRPSPPTGPPAAWSGCCCCFVFRSETMYRMYVEAYVQYSILVVDKYEGEGGQESKQARGQLR